MKEFFKKIFGITKKDNKNIILSQKPDNVNEKQDSTPSVETVIKGLTFNVSLESSSGATSTDLADELSGTKNYKKIVADEQTKNKIKELKKITDAIESKLISTTESNFKKAFKINYKDELNPQQFAAVTALDSPLLVIAGAGSGKTRVITYKVSYLIENRLNPSEILLLTFTRKAANEMLTRVQKLLGDKSISGVLGGTFHGFSNNILRKYGHLVGIPNNFTIIDIEDTKDIIDLLKAELNLSGKKNGRPFPRKSKIQSVISKSKNLELTIDEVTDKFFNENKEFTKEIELINQALSAYKKASNLLDYDDLMEVLRDKLKENETFRKKLQESIKYILVG